MNSCRNCKFVDYDKKPFIAARISKDPNQKFYIFCREPTSSRTRHLMNYQGWESLGICEKHKQIGE